MRYKEPVIDRINAKLSFPKGLMGCWEYTGFRKSGGYGYMWAYNRKRLTHRLSYAYYKGEILDGLVIRHTCDNPPCCNPFHLLIGTHADNIRDCIERGRKVNGGQILNPEDIPIIRFYLFMGENQRKLAKAYGVDRKTINDINTGKTWLNTP